MTLGVPVLPASPLRTSSTVPNPPSSPSSTETRPLNTRATEDTMRPFGGPDSPLRGATTPAGIVNKVMGGVVHRPGMTPVDGLWPAG